MADAPMLDPHGARAEILARIRSANRGGFADTRNLSAETAWRAIPRAYHETCSLPEAERIALFTERLREYGAGVYLSQPDRVGDTIAEILRKRDKYTILFSSDVDANWLLHDGCTFVSDDALSYADIEACDGVLTGCTAAIALTGTLALCHGAGHGRRVLTLLPDYHLCVVEAAAIVETVPEAMRVLEHYRLQPITLISGPSATADIEMTRIQGVHGPRVLDVVIVA